MKMQCTNLHPPDDSVYSVWGGLDGGLKVVGREGNVFHCEVRLQSVRDVLVAWNVTKLIVKTTYNAYFIQWILFEVIIDDIIYFEVKIYKELFWGSSVTL